MAVQISINRAEPGIFVVSLENATPAAFIERHRNYWSALSEGLRLQREYRPAVLHDRVVGGADEPS